MQIELTKQEINILGKALEAWEKEAGQTALNVSMMSMFLCPKEQREENKALCDIELDKAKIEGEKRKIQSLLLRAKLLQALNRSSEHEEIV